MNRVDLVGRTTSDIELRTTQSGTKVVHFLIAVNRDRKKDEADFIPCVAFSNLAEIISKYVKKGHRIAVSGRIQTGQYTKDNGDTVRTYDVIVSDLEFLEKKEGKKENKEEFKTITEDEDLPF